MGRPRGTLLLIPPKNGPSRELTQPGWSFRAAAWTAAGALLLVASAIVVLFTPWGTPGARIVAKQNASLQAESAAIEARFDMLEDTLLLIAKREEQLRMLAGLPVEA